MLVMMQEQARRGTVMDGWWLSLITAAQQLFERWNHPRRIVLALGDCHRLLVATSIVSASSQSVSLIKVVSVYLLGPITAPPRT